MSDGSVVCTMYMRMSLLEIVLQQDIMFCVCDKRSRGSSE